MDIFYGSIAILFAICLGINYYSGTKLLFTKNVNFLQFQRTYLIVYLMAMLADWLQGPHVYALYESYGMTTQQIQQLFVAGFGSSMIFGTFIGSAADVFGRRLNCLVYAVTYALACVTKHYANYYILMAGRLLAGLSTSILYSAFESWAVCEHRANGFDDDLLGNLFAHATLGNSLVAILAGMVAQVAADSFGFVAPFDCSIFVLLCLIVVTVTTWRENYGFTSLEKKGDIKQALRHIFYNRKVFCLGVIQGLFEGAMYTFVLEWTPALSVQYVINQSGDGKELPIDVKIPHGIIFTGFMICVMIGSAIFKILVTKFPVESFMRPVLIIASACLFVPAAFAGFQVPVYIAFLVFEICVGIFWPAMCTMRGLYVPEETRSTVMNFFRIPLNLIVVVIMLCDISMKNIFMLCSIFLAFSCFFQQILFKASQRTIINLPEMAEDLKPLKIENESVEEKLLIL